MSVCQRSPRALIVLLAGASSSPHIEWLEQRSANPGPCTVFSWPARSSPKVGNIEKTNWEYEFLFVDFMSTVESRVKTK